MSRAGKAVRSVRAPQTDIAVQIASRAKGIPAARSLRLWAQCALAGAQPASLTVRVVTQNEARALNHAYRGKDYATNVLTFAYDPLPDGRLHGDIVLCAAVVAAEARRQEKTLASHYAHLTLHGVLHMQGHDHERPAEARRMEALEIKLLAKLGYADPYR